MKQKAKPKKLPETIQISIPVVFRVPLTLRTKGMTVRDLARTAFMLGLELDFDVRKLKSRTPARRAVGHDGD